MKLQSIIIASLVLFTFSCKKNVETNKTEKTKEVSFEEQVEDYIQKFPYQDTYNYLVKYTGGDAAKINKWSLGEEPVLVLAGNDKVVRMNNDTYYKMAFMDLSQGPVTLNSTNPTDDRFYSFQLMDDRNVNFKNIINPDKVYSLYYGEKPEGIMGEAIQVPSSTGVVLVRVEVKNKNDESDTEAAKTTFNGITIEGPVIEKIEVVDLLSGFDEKVKAEALKQIQDKFTSSDLGELIVNIGQEVGKDISYLSLAAGTSCCWGGPDPSHSDYELIFKDSNGETLDGAKGVYTLTTDEPSVNAFWSITVYDTERGGYFHPNDENKYHINNTSAVKNEDGTVTFLFKANCEDGDINCLEVPNGVFDIAARYYLPDEKIISKEWRLSKIELVKN